MNLAASSCKTARGRRPLTPNDARALKGWFLACVMLLASIAQAAHTHGEAFRSSKTPHVAQLSATDGNADTCPLCVAMHSALAASSDLESSGSPAYVRLQVAASTKFFPAPIVFAHLSRPPPRS
jgi:hypothetical protein